MISPLASIHPNAKLGSGVRIDPFAVIHENVSIGDDSHIMSHAVILPFSSLGKSCTVFPGAVIGGIPQDLKYHGEDTTVEIGDHTTIRESVTINRGTKDKWTTKVGSHCLLMAYSHIAHDCILGDHVILANGVQLAGHVEIGEYAIIGGLAGAHQFTRIGAHTYIAGHTVIRKDVPPYVKAAREPMSYMGINIVGLQRRAFSAEKIETISRIYHLLFVANSSTSSALETISEKVPEGETREEILKFIKDSRIGIIKRYSKNSVDED